AGVVGRSARGLEISTTISRQYAAASASRGSALGHRLRVCPPGAYAADLDRGQPCGAARCRNGRAARPGADGCASAPRDSLGILTDAILAVERDSGALGKQNAITASNFASHPRRIR